MSSGTVFSVFSAGSSLIIFLIILVRICLVW